MSLLVVGSIALDSVETPTQSARDVLGGSSVYFSYAASFFTPVRLVGVVGEDFPEEYRTLLENRDIDTSGLTTQIGGETFRWSGRYLPDMNDRETLELHLNVLEKFEPELSDTFRQSEFVFLANSSPDLQSRILSQVSQATLTVADTMDLWVENEKESLVQLLAQVHGLVINDQEAKLLADDENVVRAGQTIQKLGPRFVIIKKGEHGAIFISDREMYALPAFPILDVVDPTGAGDSFAGGLMGYLASINNRQHALEDEQLKKAIAYGIVTASFTCEGFSLDRLLNIDRHDLDARYEQYRTMISL